MTPAMLSTTIVDKQAVTTVSTGARAKIAAMALSIAEVFRQAAATSPDRLAATAGDDTLTFGQIDEQANRLAHALRDAGIGRGDRVCFWSDTTLDAVPL